MNKAILVLSDGLRYDTAVAGMGYLGHLVESKLASLYKVTGELPSMSRPMYETIHTGLPLQQNLLLIEQIAAQQAWSTKTDKTNYKEYLLPSVLGNQGHKLTVLLLDNEILLNLRNRGSGGRRMPYMFGIDTFKERQLTKRIKSRVG